MDLIMASVASILRSSCHVLIAWQLLCCSNDVSFTCLHLIDSLKSFDIQAIKLLTSFKFKEFFQHINFMFLAVLMSGVGVSLISLGKGLKYLFEQG